MSNFLLWISAVVWLAFGLIHAFMGEVSAMRECFMLALLVALTARIK